MLLEVTAISAHLKVGFGVAFDLASLVDLLSGAHRHVLGFVRVLLGFLGLGELLQDECVMQHRKVLVLRVNQVHLVDGLLWLRCRLVAVVLHPLLVLGLALSLGLFDVVLRAHGSFCALIARLRLLAEVMIFLSLIFLVIAVPATRTLPIALQLLLLVEVSLHLSLCRRLPVSLIHRCTTILANRSIFT